MQLLMDEQRVARVVGELAQQILAANLGIGGGNGGGIALVGIRSRGELLAQRLAKAMEEGREGLAIDVGALDITMYRDDLSSQRGIVIPQGTQMDFRLDGRVVILVDDVVQTGRSVRAALDALVDFGRPRLIRLAVLVDRGLREHPVAADYVGMKVDAGKGGGAGQKVVVRLRPTDREDAVYLEQESDEERR